MLSKSQLYRLEFQHETIAELIEKINPKDTIKRLNPKKWSIAENVAHLGRYQEVFRERIKRILNEDKPTFDRYKAEDDESFVKWLNKSADEALVSLIEMRKELFHTLNNLTNLGLMRTGKHPKLGWMNVTEWTEFFLLHEAHHLYAIFWLKGELES